VKMGIKGEDGACVTSDFRVIGVKNLRVVDLSVCPRLPRYVL
jgi:choline dehydrogenase-like flavoprotein